MTYVYIVYIVWIGKGPTPQTQSISVYQVPLWIINENKKLQGRCKILLMKNVVLRRKVARLMKKQEKFKMEKSHVVALLSNRLPTDLYDLMKVHLSKKKPKGQRYTKEVKKMCINIYFLSPKVYRSLRKKLKLPSTSTLKRVTRKWQCESGLNYFFFEGMKQKLSGASEKYKYCTIAVDEISLNPHLNYNVANDKLEGVADFVGPQIKDKIANHATVLMARGLYENWKQPLAHWIVKDSLKADQLMSIIPECIEKLISCGFIVVGMVSDMGTNFSSFAKQMGVSSQNPYFVVNGQKIYYFFDTPHLLKATRNALLNNNIEVGEPWIDSNKPTHESRTSWSHIEQIYVHDNSMTFRAMSHIKRHHICPTNKEKMKVNYAAQILSSRMAGAIRNAVHHNDLPPSAEITAEFCFRFNRLFDICNAKIEYEENNEWKSAYKGKQKKLDFLTEMSTFLV